MNPMVSLFSYMLLMMGQHYLVEGNRTFEVDWNNDRFLMDNKPFRFIAGSFHYFRAHPATWQKSLRTMRAAGLNAVTTYVEWSLHNPHDGEYVWTGIADLEEFIRLAEAEDLFVILRPGPYICAERDFGGFPYWLLTKYPSIMLRTHDIDYLSEVRKWYNILFARLQKYLYGNGGPIIMVQVENEYGSYTACDVNYSKWLRDETQSYVGDNAVLFTNDGPNELDCGHIKGVLATLDFGSGENINYMWKKLSKVQPHGPKVNAEYYPGWLTHWSESIARVDTEKIVRDLVTMLEDGASVNFYMFYGGTNFGFTAGANDGSPSYYQPDITSYDYDAPMDEAGDPTPKYFALRSVIKDYLPLPNVPVPQSVPKIAYGTINLACCCSLLSTDARNILSKGVVRSKKPKTFEALNQYSGFVLYETALPKLTQDSTTLLAPGLHDRGYCYIDNDLIGILSRDPPVYELPIVAREGKVLQILVENQGRINFGAIHDFKGLTKDLHLNTNLLRYWNMTKYPLERFEDIAKLIEHTEQAITADTKCKSHKPGDVLHNGPIIFHGSLNISKEQGIGDTYVDMTGWGKGLLFVNGENLGRYWPLAGPQITLYVPAPVLKLGINQIVIIEYQKSAARLELKFTSKPKLDGNFV